MEEYEKCLQYLKLMKEKGIIITPYIDKEIVHILIYIDINHIQKIRYHDQIQKELNLGRSYRRYLMILIHPSFHIQTSP